MYHFNSLLAALSNTSRAHVDVTPDPGLPSASILPAAAASKAARSSVVSLILSVPSRLSPSFRGGLPFVMPVIVATKNNLTRGLTLYLL